MLFLMKHHLICKRICADPFLFGRWPKILTAGDECNLKCTHWWHFTTKGCSVSQKISWFPGLHTKYALWCKLTYSNGSMNNYTDWVTVLLVPPPLTYHQYASNTVLVDCLTASHPKLQQENDLLANIYPSTTTNIQMTRMSRQRFCLPS